MCVGSTSASPLSLCVRLSRRAVFRGANGCSSPRIADRLRCAACAPERPESTTRGTDVVGRGEGLPATSWRAFPAPIVVSGLHGGYCTAGRSSQSVFGSLPRLSRRGLSRSLPETLRSRVAAPGSPLPTSAGGRTEREEREWWPALTVANLPPPTLSAGRTKDSPGLPGCGSGPLGQTGHWASDSLSHRLAQRLSPWRVQYGVERRWRNRADRAHPEDKRATGDGGRRRGGAERPNTRITVGSCAFDARASSSPLVPSASATAARAHSCAQRARTASDSRGVRRPDTATE